jgi:hypothetical protein
MTQELATQDLPVTVNLDRPMTIGELSKQALLIQEILDNVMVGPSPENPVGVHYGVIPGTGNKKTLFQPGAEKICATFRLAPKARVEDLSEPHNNLYRFRVAVGLYTIRDGLFVGEAIGSASSLEEKYQWERAVCDEHYEVTDPSRRRIKYRKNDKIDVGFETIKQVQREAADLENTVLKIAYKRGLISATRGCTAASDLLEVDLDIPAVADLAREDHAAPPPSKPKAKPKPAPAIPYGKHKGKQITDPDVPADYLRWMADKTAQQLADPAREKFKAQDQLFLAALDAEIAHREPASQAETGKPPQEQPKTPSQTATTGPGEAQPTKPIETPAKGISDSAWADHILSWEEDHPAEYAETKKAFKVSSGHDVPADHRPPFLASMEILITTKK